MTKNQAEDDFDCLEFKRQAQARIYEKITGPSHDEEIEYFRRSVDEGPLGEWWKALEQRMLLVREKESGYGRE